MFLIKGADRRHKFMYSIRIKPVSLIFSHNHKGSICP